MQFHCLAFICCAVMMMTMNNYVMYGKVMRFTPSSLAIISLNPTKDHHVVLAPNTNASQTTPRLYIHDKYPLKNSTANFQCAQRTDGSGTQGNDAQKSMMAACMCTYVHGHNVPNTRSLRVYCSYPSTMQLRMQSTYMSLLMPPNPSSRGCHMDPD